MNKILRWFLSLSILGFVFGCNPNANQSNGGSNQKLSIKIGDRKIVVEEYNIEFGNVPKQKIEEGMLIVLDG